MKKYNIKQIHKNYVWKYVFETYVFSPFIYFQLFLYLFSILAGSAENLSIHGSVHSAYHKYWKEYAALNNVPKNHVLLDFLLAANQPIQEKFLFSPEAEAKACAVFPEQMNACWGLYGVLTFKWAVINVFPLDLNRLQLADFHLSGNLTYDRVSTKSLMVIILLNRRYFISVTSLLVIIRLIKYKLYTSFG